MGELVLSFLRALGEWEYLREVFHVEGELASALRAQSKTKAFFAETTARVDCEAEAIDIHECFINVKSICVNLDNDRGTVPVRSFSGTIPTLLLLFAIQLNFFRA